MEVLGLLADNDSIITSFVFLRMGPSERELVGIIRIPCHVVEIESHSFATCTTRPLGRAPAVVAMVPAIARGLKNRFGCRAPMSILAAIAALPRPCLNNLRAAYLEQRRPRFMLLLNWMVQ